MNLEEIKTLYCTKGSHRIGLVKNRVYPVELVLQERNRVRVRVQLVDRVVGLNVQHINRLSDADFSVCGDDPTKRARFSVVIP